VVLELLTFKLVMPTFPKCNESNSPSSRVWGQWLVLYCEELGSTSWVTRKGRCEYDNHECKLSQRDHKLGRHLVSILAQLDLGLVLQSDVIID